MYIILDLETTSLKPNQGAILEIALLKINKSGKILKKFQTLINPNQEIPAQITAITGIQAKDIEQAQAPQFAEILPKIKKIIKDLPIIGHNIGFDLEFLKNQGLDLEQNKKIDTWLLYSVFYPTLESSNLEYLANHFKLNSRPAHRAMADAQAALELFLRIQKKIAIISPALKKRALNLLKKSLWKGKDSFETLFSPEQKLNSKTPALKPCQHSPAKKTKDFSKNLNPQTQLQTILKRKLYQGEQELFTILEKAFHQEEKSIIETKKGLNVKTILALMALSFPLIKESADYHPRFPRFPKKIIFFFNTLENRQNFLKIYKKIIFKTKARKNYAILLAQNEYLCLNRFYFFLRQKKISREQTPVLLKTIFWQVKSQTGEINQIKFIKEEYKIKSFLTETGPACLKKKCKYYKKCYYFKALKKASHKPIIFSSQQFLIKSAQRPHLLFTGEKFIFIILQADALEKNITQFSNPNLNLKTLLKTLQALQTCPVADGVRACGIPDQELAQLLEKIKKYLTSIDQTLKSLFLSDYQALNYPINSQFIPNKASQPEVKKPIQYNLDLSLEKISQVPDFQKIIDQCQKIAQIKDKFLSIQPTSNQPFLAYISQQIPNLVNFFLAPQKDQIHWITLTPQTEIILNTAPLKTDLFTLLNFNNTENSGATLQSIVLMSGNLAICSNNFNYFRNILSLDSSFTTYSLASPINYSQTSRVFLVKTAEDFSTTINEEQFLKQTILQTISANPAKTMVIFKNYFEMEKAYKSLLLSIDEKITILGQGASGGQNKVVDKFLKTKRVLLLGTENYLERLKIADKNLKCVILTKLAFDFLGAPLIEKRQKLFLNGFEDFILPRSALKLKRIFNRLITYPQDQGILIILDQRLWIKPYGRTILNSLPNPRIESINLPILKEKIKNFLT